MLLRRLANPHLTPISFKPTAPYKALSFSPSLYPVDYVSGVPLNGYGSNGTDLVPFSTSASSYGKLQPYSANFSQYAPQTKAVGPVNHHSFGLPNSPLANPFTWLVHLDRQLISPMELLHVSAFHPHELTTRFIIPSGNANLPPVSQPYNYTLAAPLPANSMSFQHYVPWFDQSSRLYGFFESLEPYNGASGSVRKGRVPGKININTLWDPPTTWPPILAPYPIRRFLRMPIIPISLQIK